MYCSFKKYKYFGVCTHGGTEKYCDGTHKCNIGKFDEKGKKWQLKERNNMVWKVLQYIVNGNT